MLLGADLWMWLCGSFGRRFLQNTEIKSRRGANLSDNKGAEINGSNLSKLFGEFDLER